MAKRGRPPGRKRFSLKRAKASSDRAIARYMRQRKSKKSHKRYTGVAAKHNRSTARRGKRGLKKGHTKSAAWRKAIGRGVARAHARGAYKNRRRRSTTRRRRRAA